jgi:hypothetical protein
MSHDCYENLKKLVIFLEVLLSPDIDLVNLKKVDNLIQDFVSELSELYDEKIMLSGTHESLHLVDCTIAFGPLNFIVVVCFRNKEEQLKCY